MKKLYLISNYITSIYTLNEDESCFINIQDSITIQEAIDIFKQNLTVKTYGIIKIDIIEKGEDEKWKVIKSIQ